MMTKKPSEQPSISISETWVWLLVLLAALLVLSPAVWNSYLVLRLIAMRHGG